MLRKLGLICAVLALFSIAGGQWAMLQTVAWGGMLYGYAERSGSLAVAVAQTFDGEHPCELCREIASAKAKEQKEKPAAPGAKDDAKVKARVAEASVLPTAPPAAFLTRALLCSPRGLDRTEQPPTPPPRSGSGAA